MTAPRTASEIAADVENAIAQQKSAEQKFGAMSLPDLRTALRELEIPGVDDSMIRTGTKAALMQIVMKSYDDEVNVYTSEYRATTDTEYNPGAKAHHDAEEATGPSVQDKIEAEQAAAPKAEKNPTNLTRMKRVVERVKPNIAVRVNLQLEQLGESGKPWSHTANADGQAIEVDSFRRVFALMADYRTYYIEEIDATEFVNSLPKPPATETPAAE